jgi:mannobiose 2-epimerase
MQNRLLAFRSRYDRCLFSGLLLAVFFSMTGCSSMFNSSRPPAAGVDNNPALRKEVDAELMRELDAWYSHVVNRDEPGAPGAGEGGFHSQFDAEWNRQPGQGRFVVFQSRLTWTAAEVARRRPELAPKYSSIAAHGFEFLLNKQWDATNGGFFWELPESGAGTPQFQEKHAYGVSFGIYACTNVFAANRDRRALNLAVNAFKWLDQHAHDTVYGGYWEALGPDGTPVTHAPGNAGADPNKDRIGTEYGRKSMNTHIHLLESFTALYRVWPDRILRDRLQELFFIIRDRMPRSPGYLPLYYTPDWRPVGTEVSYGHDVETAYLLTEAADALNITNDLTALDVAKRLWNNSLTYGFDQTNGGFFTEGPAGKPATDRRKTWWVQAEALNSLLMMDAHFGLTDKRYWDAFTATWRFTTQHQIDRERGAWHDEISEDGTKVLKAAKSNDWKDPYHTVRALLNMSDALKKLPPRG